MTKFLYLLYLWCRKVYSETIQTDLHLTLTNVLTHVNLNELNPDLVKNTDSKNQLGNTRSKLETDFRKLKFRNQLFVEMHFQL